MPFKFTVGQMRTTTSVSLGQQCGYVMLEKKLQYLLFLNQIRLYGGGSECTTV